MKSLLLRIQADSPLVITEKLSRGMNHQCLQYIPGNMLLGAFAQIWKKEFFKGDDLADDDPVFSKLFLKGSVKWGCAYPQTKKGHMSVPLPVCYQKLKNHGGLVDEGVTDESCVYNALYLDANSKENNTDYLYRHYYSNEYEQNNSTPKTKKLNFCFMTDDEKPKRIDIHQHWDMHVALGQERSAIEGKLYGYNSIARGTSFISEILIDDDAVDDIKQLLPEGKNGKLHLGSSRKAGYGFASYSVLSISEKTLPKASSTAVLYLLSDYVPKKPWLSLLDGLKDDLAMAMKINRENIVFSSDKIYTGIRNLDGFNCQWNLPRQTQPAFVKGSVLVVSFKNCPQCSFPSVLGDRVTEGCGRILFDPAFLRKFEVSVTGPVQKVNIENVQSVVPVLNSSPLLKLIMQRRVQRLITENSKKFAYSDSISKFIDNIHKSPSQNQLGNIRMMLSTKSEDMWLEEFREKLAKTPGEQWKNSKSYSPFKYRKEYLSDIMVSFLANQSSSPFEDTFYKLLERDEYKDIYPLKLPVNVHLSAKEEEDLCKLYQVELHRASLLEIIKRWNRESYVKKGE